MMNCEKYQNQLEDFLYGELAERDAVALRSHLAGCPDCTALRADLERENEVFAQFYEQTQLEPSGELWRSIQAAIETSPRREPEPESARGNLLGWLFRPMVLRQAGNLLGWLFRPMVLRQAAFALALIAVTVAATMYFMRRGEDPQERIAGRDVIPSPAPTTPAPSPQSPVQSPTTAPSIDRAAPGNVNTTGREPRRPAPVLSEQQLIEKQIARAAQEYKSAIRLLDTAIAKRRDTLDPVVLREYQASLALIDDSIAQSRRALTQRPNDINAGQFLLTAYAKKVELMQDLAMR
jgi:hypothetical protein